MCEALNVKHLITDKRFLDNRLRIKNAEVLDEVLQEAILKFDQSTLIKMFDEVGAAVAACYNIKEIFEDEHFKSRKNIIAIDDQELGGPLKMQNIVGNFSRTPGKIKHTGPKLGQHNYEILVEMLGFSEKELELHGYKLSEK